MGWLVWISRAIVGLSLIGVSYFGNLFTITPPLAKEQASDRMIIAGFIVAAIIAFIVGIVFDMVDARQRQKRAAERDEREAKRDARDEERHAEYMASLGGLQNIIERLTPTAEGSTVVTPPAEETVDKATEILRALPKPTNFRMEVFGLVTAVRDALRTYHGSLDVDSFVDPEISGAFSQLLIATRKRLEGFLKRHPIVRKGSMLPVTVQRMAMLAEDLEKAADELREDIPPS